MQSPLKRLTTFNQKNPKEDMLITVSDVDNTSIQHSDQYQNSFVLPQVSPNARPTATSAHFSAFNNPSVIVNQIMEDALSSDSDSIDDDALRSVDAFSSDSESDEDVKS